MPNREFTATGPFLARALDASSENKSSHIRFAALKDMNDAGTNAVRASEKSSSYIQRCSLLIFLFETALKFSSIRETLPIVVR